MYGGRGGFDVDVIGMPQCARVSLIWVKLSHMMRPLRIRNAVFGGNSLNFYYILKIVIGEAV